MKWPWQRERHDIADKACDHLRKLQEQDAQVAELGHELRETQRRNNFSGMVAFALSRGAHEG